MPSFAGQLDEEQVVSLVAYIKPLGIKSLGIKSLGIKSLESVPP